jgi:glycosyltransferase involved in cell wall biosynthesis
MAGERVSIIIPTYNRAHSIVRALDSVLAQTYADWEAIVIDDGSTDDTATVVASRYGAEPRIRYTVKTNGGAAAARNAGLEKATGDFIGFLDSDDTWEPWKLELQLQCFRLEPEIGMVWTNMDAVAPSGALVDSMHLATMYRSRRLYSDEQLFDRTHVVASENPAIDGLAFKTGDIFSYMITGSLVHTSTVLLRRAWQQQVGFFNLAYTPLGEDFDFYLRTTRLGRVGFVNVSTVNYEVGAAGALTETRNKVHAAKNFLAAITPYIERERSSIKLSDREVRNTLAFGYAWYGSELIDLGQPSEARLALIRSLRQQWSGRTMRLIAMTCVPPALLRRARAAKRAIAARDEREHQTVVSTPSTKSRRRAATAALSPTPVAPQRSRVPIARTVSASRPAGGA